jgi:hypothetical protein
MTESSTNSVLVELRLMTRAALLSTLLNDSLATMGSLPRQTIYLAVGFDLHFGVSYYHIVSRIRRVVFTVRCCLLPARLTDGKG